MGDVDPGLMQAHHGFIADGLEQLLERHGDRVYRLALRITGVEEDAARAVEAAIRTAQTLGGEPVVESWILRTAAKAAYQTLRGRRSPVQDIALNDVLPMLDGEGRHSSLWMTGPVGSTMVGCRGRCAQSWPRRSTRCRLTTRRR